MAGTNPENDKATTVVDDKIPAVDLTKEGGFLQRWRIGEKFVFFMSNMCIYASHTFALNKYAKTAKVNYMHLSLASGATFLNGVASFIVGKLNDGTKKPKYVVVACASLYSICFLVLTLYDHFSKAKNPEYGQKNAAGFVVLVVLYSLGMFFSSGIFQTVDLMVLGMTYKLGASKESFGKQRMFGVIGHCCTTVILEVMLEAAKEVTKDKPYKLLPDLKGMGFKDLHGANKVNYIMSCAQGVVVAPLEWPVYKIFALLKPRLPEVFLKDDTIIISWIMSTSIIFILSVLVVVPSDVMDYVAAKGATKNKPEKTTITDKKTDEEKQVVKDGLMKFVSRNMDLVFFYLMVFALGWGARYITNYQSFFVDSLYHENYTPGVPSFGKPFTVLAIAKGLSEAVCYPLEKKLIALLGSDSMLLIVGVILQIGRLAIYCVLNESLFKPIGFLLDLLKGLGSGLFMCGSFRFLRERIPGPLLGESQGWLSGIYIGLSAIPGGYISGMIQHIIIKVRGPSSSSYEILPDVKAKHEIDSSLHYSALIVTQIITIVAQMAILALYVFFLFNIGPRVFKSLSRGRRGN
eukprot:GHVP01020075.1.p1 GENE.GHVP01020075.1~~GHVP01020075.1.p1  ORF type:complete len:576 (+),score=87.99 GHVP01020075.1:1168-2895(+)